MHNLNFTIPGQFVSRGTVYWPKGGMDPQKYIDWQETFRKTLLEKTESDELRSALRNKDSKLFIEITVLGFSKSIVALDLDNIAKTVFDNITKTLVPKEKGSRTPNWEDRHFWKAKISKFIDEEDPENAGCHIRFRNEIVSKFKTMYPIQS